MPAQALPTYEHCEGQSHSGALDNWGRKVEKALLSSRNSPYLLLHTYIAVIYIGVELLTVEEMLPTLE